MVRPTFRLVLLAAVALALAVPGLGRAPAAGAAASDRVVARSATGFVPAGSVGLVRVKCPARTRPVGTGVSLGAAPRSLRYLGAAFVRFGEMWGAKFYAENLGTEAFPFAGTVLCLKASGGLTYPATVHDAPPTVVTTKESSCPSGTRVGGAGRASVLSEGPPPYLLGEYPNNGAWALRVENRFPNARPAAITTQPACATAAALGNRRVAVVRYEGALPGESRERHVVSCPRGAEIAAGGFTVSTEGGLLSTSQPAPVAAGQPEGWLVSVINRSALPQGYSAYAVCLAAA